ncbi:uncharacterized protein LAESUDRAFT_755622 [Laetiporus sulphureus 93-53]|uniref:Uncharacterized protein n=1 Tax=Laetiporus sulphureus 93-53 TaxID=1314785 RepID=A0A165GYA3_9APHY|nr:uncharacterized protein LAESUDRAFT_755622 [Laetiporus sulphureus 93-53]KZT10994.1 hypothetical protein LAESUDRAFT_755622 [Laetiporus sulphureus 93-53]
MVLKRASLKRSLPYDEDEDELLRSHATTPPPSQSLAVEDAAQMPSQPSGSSHLQPRRSAANPEHPVEQIVTKVSNSSFYVASNRLFEYVEWRKYGDYDILVVKGAPEPEGREAEVEWIGEIDPTTTRYYLTACGKWNGRFDKEFSAAKARAHIIEPTNPQWKELGVNWDNVLHGFRSIINSKMTKDATCNRTNSIIDEQWDPTSVKVRHAIFERVKPDEVVIHSSDDPFSMTNWRCEYGIAQQELQKIIRAKQFKECTLPAYKMDEELILPNEYEAQLRGAVVHVKACISHRHVQKTDNYYADIRMLRVLKAPATVPHSPESKRLEEAKRRARDKHLRTK